jgi:hypothetical protein
MIGRHVGDDTRSGPENNSITVDGDDEVAAAVYADIKANITHYTERPDLLLEVLEKYDKGFIKAINAESIRQSESTRESRFRFGEIQAYSALGVSVLAAFITLFGAMYLIHTNQAGLLNFLGLSILYAVTQGGTRGFLKIIDGIQKLATKIKSDNP